MPQERTVRTDLYKITTPNLQDRQRLASFFLMWLQGSTNLVYNWTMRNTIIPQYKFQNFLNPNTHIKELLVVARTVITVNGYTYNLSNATPEQKIVKVKLVAMLVRGHNMNLWLSRESGIGKEVLYHSNAQQLILRGVRDSGSLIQAKTAANSCGFCKIRTTSRTFNAVDPISPRIGVQRTLDILHMKKMNVSVRYFPQFAKPKKIKHLPPEETPFISSPYYISTEETVYV